MRLTRSGQPASPDLAATVWKYHSGVAEREVAVIVPAHRAAAFIDVCLEGLERQTLDSRRFAVHVVDSGADHTAEIVQRRVQGWGGRLHYHRAPPGSGPAEKRNLGARRADSRYLAFTDADCIPEPEWLAAGLRRLCLGASLVAGRTLEPVDAFGHRFDHRVVVEDHSPLYESCNVLYDATSFSAAGGFPTALFERTGEVFGEDAELAWSVRRSGGVAVFAPDCVVRHQVVESSYAQHLRRQWRARLFPLLVRRVPELRTELLRARLFLGPRSLRFDSALAGIALRRRLPAAALLMLPYLLKLIRAARTRPGAPVVPAAKLVLSDCVRAGALAWGSARYRSPVL